ncbi:MAG: transglutaminase domain-containing protein [Eubacterium sp.]|nr:transglutaminase domain-containing protein [Eubacterium sp.]
MKKRISLIIMACLAFSMLQGCGSKKDKKENTEVAKTEASSTADVTEDKTTEDKTAEDKTSDEEVAEGPTVPEKQPGHYEFKHKVCSGYMKDLFGETMCETWYNLVDAVLAGEDTFECPDYETYRWVMGQFPERLFPVLVDVLDYPLPEETAVIDGIAHFNYKYDHEQVSKRISDFENMIVEILNESMEDDYSDFEKVIALYNYFAHHYTYDYDLYERKQAGEFVELSSINFLDKGTGICQEISTAYSYILLQAGVEATTMSGIRGYDNMSHAWSYVKINGHEYHIDPTFVLDDNTLSYLMMNDDRRSNYDDFDRSTYRITSNYSQDHPVPEFVANDDKFSPIWNTKFEAIDTEKDVLYCKYIDDNGVWQNLEFDYSGY